MATNQPQGRDDIVSCQLLINSIGCNEHRSGLKRCRRCSGKGSPAIPEGLLLKPGRHFLNTNKCAPPAPDLGWHFNQSGVKPQRTRWEASCDRQPAKCIVHRELPSLHWLVARSALRRVPICPLRLDVDGLWQWPCRQQALWPLRRECSRGISQT